VFATRSETGTISRHKLGKELGRAGQRRWYRHGDRELAVRLSPVSGEPLDPRALYVTELVDDIKHGTPHRATLSFEAELFPAGTYERNAPRKPLRPSVKPRTWDALSAAHEKREPVKLPIPASASSGNLLEPALREAVGAEPAPLIEVGHREGAELSVDGLVSWLERRGVRLEVHRGHLLARSSKPRPARP
jgi:hypothetical protein